MYKWHVCCHKVIAIRFCRMPLPHQRYLFWLSPLVVVVVVLVVVMMIVVCSVLEPHAVTLSHLLYLARRRHVQMYLSWFFQEPHCVYAKEPAIKRQVPSLCPTFWLFSTIFLTNPYVYVYVYVYVSLLDSSGITATVSLWPSSRTELWGTQRHSCCSYSCAAFQWPSESLWGHHHHSTLCHASLRLREQA